MKNKSLFLLIGIFAVMPFDNIAGPCATPVTPNPYTKNFPVGWTFFANHLINPGGNTLDVLFPNPPDQTVLYKYISNLGYVSSLYDSGLGVWSDSTLTLNPGEGGLIYAKTAFSQMFSGTEPSDTPITIAAHTYYLVGRQKGGCPGEYSDMVSLAASEGMGLYRYIGSFDPTFNGFNEIAYEVFYYHSGNWLPSVPIIPAWESVFVGPAPAAVIEGTVFEDPLGNCTGTTPLANWIIKLERVPASADTTVYAITDAFGKYRIFPRRAGSYRVSAPPKTSWAQTCPITPTYYPLTTAGFNVFSGRDFRVKNTGSAAKDLQVDMVPFFPWPLATPCCGQGMYYLISYRNLGSSSFNSPTVKLFYPPDVTPLFAVPPPTPPIPNPSPLIWPLPNLLAGASGSILVGVTVNPCTLPHILTAMATIGHPNPGPPESALLLSDNMASDTESVVCSYDPNDKKVSPRGCGPMGLIPADQTLTYLVQFQNLGNGPAYQVVVRDTLDSDLDLSSLELISSSHRQILEINGRELVWTFPIIKLPPASSDEPGSHGYVKFKVRPRSDITPGIVITNQAAIYFDLNEPVLTVITTNTITADPLPVASFTATPRPGSAGSTNDFTYTGGSAGAQFLWTFGPDATPATSTMQDPVGVVFSSSGPKTATLRVTLGSCASEPAAEILLVGQPQIQTQWDGNQLGMSWEGNGFLLQEKSDLSPATPWILSSATVTRLGSLHVANVVIEGSMKFFRLGDSPP